MSSARDQVLAATVTCLSAIRTADGYNTDAGALVTREPGQVRDDATSALSVTIGRQQRATEPALVRTHRLTDLSIVIKVPTDLDNEQARLDQAVTDVERAMDPASGAPRYPNGIAFPQFAEMRPLHPEKDSAGWIGALLLYQTHIPIR